MDGKEHREYRVLKEYKVSQDLPERQDQRVHREYKVQLDRLAHKDY